MLSHQSIECDFLEVNVAIKYEIFPYCCLKNYLVWEPAKKLFWNYLANILNIVMLSYAQYISEWLLLFTAVKFLRFMLKMEITDTYRLLTYLVDVIRWSSMVCMAWFTCKLYIPTGRYGAVRKVIRGSKTLIRRIVENIVEYLCMSFQEAVNQRTN